MIGTPFFGGHVVHWTPYFRGTSLTLQEICKLLDMKKIRTSHYRPQTDGLVERYNRTLKSTLKSFCDSEKSDWDNHLPYVMMAYKTTVQESTRCNLLMFGQEIKLPVECRHNVWCCK